VGTALRWVSVTDGDNGLRGLARPAPFGINLDGATAFYYFSLVITVIAIAFMARFVASPFGAALKGTRDQSRRMSALGHDVWMIRWLTFIYAGFWGAVSGCCSSTTTSTSIRFRCRSPTRRKGCWR